MEPSKRLVLQASRTWVWALPVGSALALCATRAYRSFPSVDDLAHVPAAWVATEPNLFPGDAIAHAVGGQVPLWGLAVRLAGITGNLANGFSWLTLGLCLAIAVGAFRLTRALSVRGVLVPLALLIGYFGPAGDLVSREYGVHFGTAFRAEWLALALLLWCYDAFTRGRAVATGVLLGLATLAYPMAGLHGIITLSLATPLAARPRGRRLAIVLAIAGAIGAPAVISLVGGGISGDAILRDTYLYRLSGRYELEWLSPRVGLAAAILLLTGLLGTVLLARGERAAAARALAGLLLGHGILAGAAVVCYRLGPETWRSSATWHFLDLTLTAPLLPLLGAIAALAALEARFADRARGEGESRIPWLAIGTVCATFLISTRIRMPDAEVPVHDVRARALQDSDDTELYTWARQTTARSALFIVPPSARGFRFYARRGVYVEYGLFPASNTAAVRMWRERLERVTASERRAFQSPPWKRLFMLDRAYANRNTPTRIAQLLEETGAAYFVWDTRGLDIPPFLPVARPPDARLVEVFRNRAYITYALARRSDASR